MTEYSENLSIVMSENGLKSYHFETPLMEGYTLARDPYREFRKGIKITMFEEDSTSNDAATLTANYAIFYENRKLWEAKGDVVVIQTNGRRLYTQQLFWNQSTHRIYSNVDSRIVDGDEMTDCEGFESDEEMTQWKYRKLKGVTYFTMSEDGGVKSDSTKVDNTSSRKEPAKSTSRPAAKRMAHDATEFPGKAALNISSASTGTFARAPPRTGSITMTFLPCLTTVS